MPEDIELLKIKIEEQIDRSDESPSNQQLLNGQDLLRYNAIVENLNSLAVVKHFPQIDFSLITHAAHALANTSFAFQSDAFRRYISRLKENRPSPAKLFYIITAITMALPFIPYCFTSTPERINQEWWHALPLEDKVFLTVSALVYFAVAIGTRYNYLQLMVNNLKKIFTHYCDNTGNFITNNAILLASFISGLPIGALGYYGASWAGKRIAGASALSSFLTICVFRIPFLANFIKMTKNLLDEDRIFQKNLVLDLKQLKDKEVGDGFLINQNELNEEVIIQFLRNIYDKESEQNASDSLFNLPSTGEKIQRNLRSFFAMSVGLFVSAAFFIFISQSSYDGFKLLCLAFLANCQIDELTYGAKLMLAFTPSITALLMAFMLGFEFVNELISDVYLHLKQKPIDLIKAVVVLGSCLLTSLSLMNAAKSIATRPNLFELSLSDNLGFLAFYLIGNYGTAMALDLSACLKVTGLTNHVNTPPTTGDVINWMKKNELSPSAVKDLQQHGLFKMQSRSSKKLQCNNILKLV